MTRRVITTSTRRQAAPPWKRTVKPMALKTSRQMVTVVRRTLTRKEHQLLTGSGAAVQRGPPRAGQCFLEARQNAWKEEEGGGGGGEDDDKLRSDP
ncbi:hypothetical protein TYRP_010312 [Tyrophagus putrescentiae]|nr:hypothetical protein TYRP_010312 [Tyrophagus putrescentiae]